MSYSRHFLISIGVVEIEDRASRSCLDSDMLVHICESENLYDVLFSQCEWAKHCGHVP